MRTNPNQTIEILVVKVEQDVSIQSIEINREINMSSFLCYVCTGVLKMFAETRN